MSHDGPLPLFVPRVLETRPMRIKGVDEDGSSQKFLAVIAFETLKSEPFQGKSC